MAVHLRSCPVQVTVSHLPEPGKSHEIWEQACSPTNKTLKGPESGQGVASGQPSVVIRDAEAMVFRMFAQQEAIEYIGPVVKETLGLETV